MRNTSADTTMSVPYPFNTKYYTTTRGSVKNPRYTANIIHTPIIGGSAYTRTVTSAAQRCGFSDRGLTRAQPCQLYSL
jgi:hypothetical protein